MARMSTIRMKAAVGLAALLVVSHPAAAAANGRAKSTETRARTSAEHTATRALILGVAWKGDNTPIAHARLRLRDVVTGRAEAITVANVEGQFSFANVEPGTFVVELINEDGRVLAVGPVFAIARGETATTFVRLPTRRRLLGGFLSNAAVAAVTAASGLGLTALGSNGQPVSPSGSDR